LRRVVVLLKLGALAFCAFFGGLFLLIALEEKRGRATMTSGGLSGIVAACLLLSSSWFLSYDGLPTWLVYLPLGLSPLAIMLDTENGDRTARVVLFWVRVFLMLPSLLLTWNKW
jgi:hypothetical protein